MPSHTSLLSRRFYHGKAHTHRGRFAARIIRLPPKARAQTLFDIFTAVSEGRLSPFDAAQTVEEALCHVPSPRRSGFPQIVNGRGKRPEWIAGRIRELLKEQGRALVTEMDPSDYAIIRKTVPGVVYHAGAKTLRIDGAEAGEKLPGTVGIVSDTSVPATAMEQLHIMAEFLGCYTFQVPSLTVTHLPDVIDHMKSVAQASAVLVLYDEETALPDIVSGSIEAPVISVRVGDHRPHQELPYHTLSTGTLLSAVLSAVKILKAADRLNASRRPLTETGRFERVRSDVTLDEQIQEALEMLDGKENVHRVNNVVSKDLHEATAERSSD